MTQTSDTLLRLQDVSKRFGKKTALDLEKQQDEDEAFAQLLSMDGRRIGT